jgi:hypothetical protein
VLAKTDLEKIYLPWIRASMADFSYSELQNVAYGLMFSGVNEKEIWSAFVRNVAT